MELLEGSAEVASLEESHFCFSGDPAVPIWHFVPCVSEPERRTEIFCVCRKAKILTISL